MKVFKALSGLITAAVLTASTDGSAAGTVDRDISGQGGEASEWRRIGVETLVIDASGLGTMRISKAPERGAEQPDRSAKGWFGRLASGRALASKAV